MVLVTHLVLAKAEFQTRLKNVICCWFWQITNLEHIEQQNKIIHRKLYLYSFSQKLFKIKHCYYLYYEDFH